MTLSKKICIFLMIANLSCGSATISGPTNIDQLKTSLGKFIENKDLHYGIMDAALDNPGVAYHVFLICGRSCQMQDNETFFDYVFKKGLYAFKEIESHRDHVLYLMAQMGVPLNETLVFSDRKTTVQELLDESIGNLYIPTNIRKKNNEMPRDMELGWSLCAYSAYLPFDALLYNKNGQVTDLKRLAAHVALNSKFNEIPEGGTHEIMGLGCIDQKLSEISENKKAFEEKLLETIVKQFIYSKLDAYLITVDKNGDFHVHLTDEEKRDEFEKIAGPHSVAVAVGGHILSAVGQVYKPQEISKDPRIIKATERLVFHMQKMSEELQPVHSFFGMTQNDGKGGVYQRCAYAHAFEALTLILKKLEALD